MKAIGTLGELLGYAQAHGAVFSDESLAKLQDYYDFTLDAQLYCESGEDEAEY